MENPSPGSLKAFSSSGVEVVAGLGMDVAVDVDGGGGVSVTSSSEPHEATPSAMTRHIASVFITRPLYLFVTFTGQSTTNFQARL